MWLQLFIFDRLMLHEDTLATLGLFSTMRHEWQTVCFGNKKNCSCPDFRQIVSEFHPCFPHVKCIHLMSMAWKKDPAACRPDTTESCSVRSKSHCESTQLVLVEACCLLSRASSRRSFALSFLYWQYSSAIGPRSSFWQALLENTWRKEDANKRQNPFCSFQTTV